MNLPIKIKILESGISQFQLSRAVGVSDGYLSKIIRGWVDPKTEVKERIATALGCPVKDLFPGRRI